MENRAPVEKLDKVCCLNRVLPDENGKPDFTLLKFQDQGKMDKCVLIGMPVACHVTGKCLDECSELFKKSLRWFEMLKPERQKEVNQVRKQTQETVVSATKVMQEAKLTAQKAEEAKVQLAEEMHTKSVSDADEALGKKQQAVRDITETVEKLRVQLEEAEKQQEFETQQLEAQERFRAEALEAAAEALQRTRDEALAAREAAEHAAEALFDEAQQGAQEAFAAASEKLEFVANRTQELEAIEEGPESPLTAQAKRGVCGVQGDRYAAVDCCCSIHPYQDGSGPGTAMRVKGNNFISWEVCEGARKYKDTSTYGWSCKWFGHCNKCEDLICKDKKGQLIDCP